MKQKRQNRSMTPKSVGGLAIGVFAFLVAIYSNAQSEELDIDTAHINWQVKDRFRLFDSAEIANEIIADKSPSELDKFLNDLKTISEESDNKLQIYEKIRDFLRTEHDFGNGKKAPFLATKWEAAGLDANNMLHQNRRYEKNYLFPKYYFAQASLDSFSSGGDCIWTIKGEDYEKTSQKIGCSNPVSVPIPANKEHNGSIPIDVKVLTNEGTTFETKIQIKDNLILGIGDSYASGEGNPDKPQKFKDEPKAQKAIEKFFDSNPDPYEKWWAEHSITTQLDTANWWDPLCHRSLFSPHAIASIFYSAKHPHEAVSFASFACSGAEGIGGVLGSQFAPVGINEFGTPNAIKSLSLRAKPQLSAAIELLCNNSVSQNLRQSDFTALYEKLKINKDEAKNLAKFASATELKCEGDQKPRNPDYVFISLGGNDAGFVSSIVNLLLPEQTNAFTSDVLLGFIRNTFKIQPNYISSRKARFELPLIYSNVDKALKTAIVTDATQIIQTQYPNPFYDESGRVICDGPKHNGLFAAFNGLYLEADDPKKRWRTNITATEGRELKEGLFEPINETITKNQSRGWKIVSFGNEFENRGWCAGNEKEHSEFSFPAIDMEGNWSGFSPFAWDAYAHRTRLFRTANDAVLTQIGSNNVFGIIDQAFNRDRSMFATFGMFHPTAEGYSIMGIEIEKAMKK